MCDCLVPCGGRTRGTVHSCDLGKAVTVRVSDLGTGVRQVLRWQREHRCQPRRQLIDHRPTGVPTEVVHRPDCHTEHNQVRDNSVSIPLILVRDQNRSRSLGERHSSRNDYVMVTDRLSPARTAARKMKFRSSENFIVLVPARKLIIPDDRRRRSAV